MVTVMMDIEVLAVDRFGPPLFRLPPLLLPLALPFGLPLGLPLLGLTGALLDPLPMAVIWAMDVLPLVVLSIAHINAHVLGPSALIALLDIPMVLAILLLILLIVPIFVTGLNDVLNLMVMLLVLETIGGMALIGLVLPIAIPSAVASEALVVHAIATAPLLVADELNLEIAHLFLLSLVARC